MKTVKAWAMLTAQLAEVSQMCKDTAQSLQEEENENEWLSTQVEHEKKRGLEWLEALGIWRLKSEQLEADLKALKEFSPTAMQVNALPERLRRYIHDIETSAADQTGNIREAICQRENAMALAIRVRELEADLNALKEQLWGRVDSLSGRVLVPSTTQGSTSIDDSKDRQARPRPRRR